jgi:hypothetical protein
MTRRLPHRVRRVSRTPVLLDIFTEQDIERWAARSEVGQNYADRVYFDLERQRAARHDDLCEALRATEPIEVELHGWARVTDYRWSLTPLASAGSLGGIGGRFNIGRDLDRARNQEFPALYLAADVDTAFCEFFGGPPEREEKSGLTLQAFALRRRGSFTTFGLQGRVDNVFDLRGGTRLKEFAAIIRSFQLSPETRRYARKAGLRNRRLLRTAKELHTRVLAAPASWRTEPQLFGIPASSQILGRFIRDAGFDGTLYPSQQGGTLCLAVFPENIRTAGTRIEVLGGAPDEATCLVMDKGNRCI